MSKIVVGQQIYANVEKEQSPQKIAGFQTLFYSRSFLSEEEVQEIERRLVYFPSAEKNYLKRIFFVTSTNKYVLAQIVPLPEPDQLGRKGRYLAHVLIFKEEDFLNHKLNPWVVFQKFYFVKTLEEALKLGNFETGDLPSMTIDLVEFSENLEIDFSLFKGENFKKLALLAFRGKELMNQRKTVVFLGEPQEVELALKLATFVVPTPLLKYCTFDTYFYRCNLVSTYYWGIGLFDSPSKPNLIIVKVNSGEVLSEVDRNPENAYERWILKELDRGNFHTISFYKDSAFILTEWLDGRISTSSSLNQISSEIIPSVFEANSEKVWSKISDKILEKFPSLLASKVVTPLFKSYSSFKLFKKLQEGFSYEELLDLLLEIYASQNYTSPPQSELKALGQVLTTVDYHLLKLFYLCWKKEYKELSKLLEKLEDSEYTRFLERVLKYDLINPAYLVVPKKGKLFLSLYLSEEIPQKRDWLSLVKALLEAKEGEALDLLIPYIAQWSPQVIKKVKDLIVEHPEVPSSFREAINKVAALIHLEEKGIKGWLKSILEKIR